MQSYSPNMTSWQTRLAKGKTTGKGGGKEITVSLSSRGWNSDRYDEGGYIMVVIGGNPIAELKVEPSISLTMKAKTTELVLEDAS